MKKLLTGFCNNITQNANKIKYWATSFRKFSDGDIVLIASNINNEDEKILSKLNINYIKVIENDTWYIYHKRLKHQKEFIERSDADLFLVTDVFDVIFQGDPFQKMDTNNYDVFISKEGIKVMQEPWNGDVIKRVFPDHIHSCLETEIVCSGIIGGKKEALINLYGKMYDMCEKSLNGHNIKDQASLIILVKDNWIKNLKNFDLDEGWAIHCQSAGPTVFFEQWGLRKSLLNNKYGIPVMKEDGVIYTQSGIKYDIVHQFNRVKEWEKKIINNYE